MRTHTVSTSVGPGQVSSITIECGKELGFDYCAFCNMVARAQIIVEGPDGANLAGLYNKSYVLENFGVLVPAEELEFAPSTEEMGQMYDAAVEVRKSGGELVD